VRGKGGKRDIITLTHSVKHGSLRKLAENVKLLAAADTFIQKNMQHIRRSFPRALDFYRVRKNTPEY
jgi:hypothetical protein